MRCDFRDLRECGCPIGTCATQPRTPAPVVSFSWRQHAATLAFGIVVALLVFGTITALQAGERQYQMKARV